MPGSSWTGSAQDESEDLASRVANSIGEAGAGRQSLTDAIVQRVVETVRAAVIVTTESMAELSTDLNERYDRLEGQIGALAEHFSGGPALAAAPVAGGFDRFEAIIDRLERVEALLDRPTVEAAAAQSAPEIDMTPVWETIEALRHELIARTGDSHPVDELRDDLVEVRRALAALTEMA